MLVSYVSCQSLIHSRVHHPLLNSCLVVHRYDHLLRSQFPTNHYDLIQTHLLPRKGEWPQDPTVTSSVFNTSLNYVSYNMSKHPVLKCRLFVMSVSVLTWFFEPPFTPGHFDSGSVAI